ncbi:MAG: hypothetical protein HY717_02900 [Planctomycetes bacterium]|nr:hypothetical protein [Planctomycetota bacterium]
MQRASKLFTAAEKEQISAAVREVESKTAAEIVPVVASASGRYDRPEDMIGLWTALLALSLTWWLFPGIPEEPHGWGEALSLWELAAYLAAVIVGFLAGVFLGGYIGWLRRLFTPERQMRAEVELRAHALFTDRRIYRTAGATGLMVYLSLFERQAMVIADRAIVEKLGQAAVEEWCSLLVRSLKTSGPMEALCQAIRTAGESLGAALPRPAGDINELGDALVLID